MAEGGHKSRKVGRTVQPQLIGNWYVRCLRVIQFPALKSHHIFHAVYYVPVELNSFQIIAIELVNKFGDLARISNSIKPTTLILHFKKIILLFMFTECLIQHTLSRCKGFTTV
jgi:hypothetical protein